MNIVIPVIAAFLILAACLALAACMLSSAISRRDEEDAQFIDEGADHIPYLTK